MQHGALTARLGSFLSGALKQQAVDVLYDHGRQVKNALTPVGRLSAWFGDHYGANSLLAHIDLAVVEHGSDKALALVEIEETTDKPKVLLGDVLAILLGNGVRFRGNRVLRIGPWTSLIVLAYRPTIAHNKRAAFLEEQTNSIRMGLSTPNAAIGKIHLQTFRSEEDLKDKASRLLGQALTSSQV
jgi:hypothetical protein